MPGDEVIFSYMVVEDKEVRENDTPIHRNQFRHDGKYYWKVDMMHVLGYIREEKFVPASGYVFLKDVPKKEPEMKELGDGVRIYIPEMARTGRQGNRAEVISVGEAKPDRVRPGIEEGEIIIYDDRYAQRYSIKGQDIIILPQEYVAAVETLETAA
jgi:co-chaperonin GroES (HSP10)